MPTFHGTAELRRAINAVWDASPINAAFQAYWDEQQRGGYSVLNYGDASPNQPWPFCVYLITTSKPTIGMSGKTTDSRREIRDSIVEFHVFARHVSDTSAGELAALMADEVRKVYGGHPSTPPTRIPGVLLAKPQDEFDYPRAGDDEHKWLLRYMMRTDLQRASIPA